jgi:hypothetical protein
MLVAPSFQRQQVTQQKAIERRMRRDFIEEEEPGTQKSASRHTHTAKERRRRQEGRELEGGDVALALSTTPACYEQNMPPANKRNNPQKRRGKGTSLTTNSPLPPTATFAPIHTNWHCG